MAINNCLEVRKSWERRPQKERAEIFAEAAELMSKKYRYDLLATTMLGQVGVAVTGWEMEQEESKSA